jgi:hypothetical protein
MDISNFHGIEVIADAADSQLKCGSDSLLRRLANATTLCFIGYAHEMPSISPNPSFQ